MRLAERSFRRALAKDPEDAAALNGLGFCLLNSGKAAEAKEYFEKCLELDPNAAGAMNGLARCLKAEGKVDEAIAVWEEHEREIPRPERRHRRPGDDLSRTRRKRQSAAALRRARQIDARQRGIPAGSRSREKKRREVTAHLAAELAPLQPKRAAGDTQ